MSILRMKAIQAFEDMEGKIAEGEHFLVNEERAFFLTRTGKAVHAPEPAEPVVEVAPPAAERAE